MTAPSVSDASLSCLAEGELIQLPILMPAPRLGFVQFRPQAYVTMGISCVDFLFGGFVGLYIGFKSGYIQEGISLKIFRHIYFDAEGLEVGGRPRDWIRWLWNDRANVVQVSRNALVYAMAGGVTQSAMCVAYKSLFSADGHVIPSLATYFIMTFGDDNFFWNYRNMGDLAYISGFFELCMMLCFRGNSTYWVRHYLERYILRGFQHFSWPLNWAWGQP